MLGIPHNKAFSVSHHICYRPQTIDQFVFKVFPILSFPILHCNFLHWHFVQRFFNLPSALVTSQTFSQIQGFSDVENEVCKIDYIHAIPSWYRSDSIRCDFLPLRHVRCMTLARRIGFSKLAYSSCSPFRPRKKRGTHFKGLSAFRSRVYPRILFLYRGVMNV